jgi:hypothetical protein
MEAGLIYIGAINTPEGATSAWAELKKIENSLTSEKELKAAFAAKVKDLSYTYDKEKKCYVSAAE